ncbi:MAG: HAMP domain-containing protein [Anaerolineales bacterium]|nr:HAMP domain-containing protein [Anaerolineales bacterium]
MKNIRSLNTRLVLSHLAVSLVSIVLMAVFAGQSISRAAYAEAEHNLQDLAFATANALELPIQELSEGTIEPQFIKDMLSRMYADNPQLQFTVYRIDGRPIVDSTDSLPPRANRNNAPEVIDALESDLGRGVNIRRNNKGKSIMHMAVLVQREIEVTGILRLSISMQPTEDAARNSLAVLLFAALAIASGVSLVGWMLAKNLARPIQVLTRAAENMERGDLGVRVPPSGPQELRRLAEAFNSMANRLQSNVNELRAFVANASHELRTPLTVVKLRAEALREGALEEPEVAGRFLGEIETEVDRLVRMVNDLLDLSRMEAGLETSQRTILNLGTVAHDVYETFNIRATRVEVDLKLDIEPGLPSVLGNEDQIRRVLYNLVENAIKYTPSGGQVEMLLRPGSKQNTVRMLVRDTGPGIASEHLPHVFERFYRAETTTSSRPGTIRGSGLGLAIAKSIVENHGGEIGVSSQVGNGATFWADLPAT